MATSYQTAVRIADADRLRKNAQDQMAGTVNGQTPNYRNLIRAGATQEEVQAFNDTGVVPQSFYDRNGQSGPMYVSLYGYDKVPGSSYENWRISDQNKDFYQQVQKLYQSGDVTGAINLLNEKRGKDNDFTGYYDDQGNYWGWVRGEGGASGNSFQPVLGGQLMATGKSDTGTWLTPDGQILHGTIGGGGLTNNGLTWTNRHVAPRGYNTWGERMDEYGLTWDQVAQAKAANGDYTDPSLNTEMGNAKAYYRLTTKPDYMDDAEWERYSKMWDPAYIQGFKNGANGQVFTPVTDYGIDYTPSSSLLPSEYRGSQNYTGGDGSTGNMPAGYVPRQSSSAPSIPQSSTAPSVSQTTPGYTPSPAGGSNGASGGTSGGSVSNTPYSQAVSQYTPKAFDQPQPEAYKPTEAPAAYDPESNTQWQDYLKQYGNVSQTPEWTGGDFDHTQNSMYQEYMNNWQNAQAPEYEGDPYQERRDALLEQAGSPWEGSEYQQRRDEALSRAADMEWNYNPDEDPVWQAYQKQYRREGQRATQDTLGQAAAMTGGMASTAAVTAASQAGDYYASQLSDKLPQLYNDAYNRYLQEYQRQLGISDAYANADNTEYSRWLQQQGMNMDMADRYNQYGLQDYGQYQDRLGQWNTDRNFAYGTAQDAIANSRADYNTRYQQYLDNADRFANDRAYNYGVARDSQSMGRTAAEDQYSRWGTEQSLGMQAADAAYKRWQDALAQNNYENEFAYQQTRDAESDRQWQLQWNQKVQEYQDALDREDREWAQKLVEYADSQNWKRAEFEQYLREYEDQLTKEERDYVYKLMQAEEDKRQWDLKFQYGQYRDSISDAQWEAQMRRQENRDMVSDAQYTDSTNYQRALDAWEMGNTEYDRLRKDAEWRAQYGDYSGLRELGIDVDSWIANQQQPTGGSYYYRGGGGSGSGGGDTTDYAPAAAPQENSSGGVQITNPVGASGQVNVDGRQFSWPELQRAYERGEVTAQYDSRTGQYTFHTSTRGERIEDWNR